MNTKQKHYRLYIDESGNHSYSKMHETAKRFLGITGIMVESEYYRQQFHPSVEALKQKYFPHSPDDPVILHRKEILNRRGSFWRLRHPEIAEHFNDELLQFLHTQHFGVFSVVIDKQKHQESYQEFTLHPYHVCMIVLLERYCGMLNSYHLKGDVFAESRGGHEDRQLKDAYARVYTSGTQYREARFFQQALTSPEIQMRKKTDNIAGLQIADLLAHPCKNDILFEQGKIGTDDLFGEKIRHSIQSKQPPTDVRNHLKIYTKVFLG